MNTNARTAESLAREVAEGVRGLGAEVFVCPPFPYLLPVGRVLESCGSGVLLAAQDLWTEPDGAFTGEVSAVMLVDCGVRAVLIGHSERRHVIGEGDDLINRKVRAALDADLVAVLCVGETLEQRERGETDAVNAAQVRAGLAGVSADQMSSVVIAYEPVWAIGTGRTATAADAQDAHGKIRGLLAELFGDGVGRAMRIQYGGSVKPGNAAELFGMPDIDGGLIGGASLNAADFLGIVRAAGA